MKNAWEIFDDFCLNEGALDSNVGLPIRVRDAAVDQCCSTRSTSPYGVASGTDFEISRQSVRLFHNVYRGDNGNYRFLLGDSLSKERLSSTGALLYYGQLLTSHVLGRTTLETNFDHQTSSRDVLYHYLDESPTLFTFGGATAIEGRQMSSTPHTKTSVDPPCLPLPSPSHSPSP